MRSGHGGPRGAGVEIRGFPRYVGGMKMCRSRFWLLAVTGLLAQGFAVAAWGQAKPAAPAKPETVKLGSFKNWHAYQLNERDGRICYLHGIPAKQEPGNLRRGEVYLLVTHKPARKIRNEVSVFFGYPLKPQTDVEAMVGKDVVKLFTHEEAAWAPDAAFDALLVDTLKKGKTLQVKGESARGSRTTDSYDLAGFNDALKAIDRACPP